jgi:hypothetical protein
MLGHFEIQRAKNNDEKQTVKKEDTELLTCCKFDCRIMRQNKPEYPERTFGLF